MQNQNEDTEWNDILRSRGIIPNKEKEITEEEIVNLVQSTIDEKSGAKKNLNEMTVEQLDELEDDEDEVILLRYRNQRIAELKALAAKSKYGDVTEISAQDYINEVNKAGSGVWVVLHLYKPGFPVCSLINQQMAVLASKFKTTKFLRSISTICIPNYPDRNLPSIFVYYEGKMVHKFVGTESFPKDMTIEELEWMLGKVGAVPTEIEENPRQRVKDVLFAQLKSGSI